MPRKSHGKRSLAGYSPWGRVESDRTELLTLSLHTLEPSRVDTYNSPSPPPTEADYLNKGMDICLCACWLGIARGKVLCRERHKPLRTPLWRLWRVNLTVLQFHHPLRSPWKPLNCTPKSPIVTLPTQLLRPTTCNRSPLPSHPTLEPQSWVLSDAYTPW